MMEAYMVFDIGGTYIKYSVMNKATEKLASGKVSTPEDGLESFLEKISDIANEFKTSFDIRGIALSSPGAVKLTSLDSNR